MANIPHNKQMCVCIHMHVLWGGIYAIGQTQHMSWYRVAKCIMRDIDQCKISVVSYAKTFVIHG